MYLQLKYAGCLRRYISSHAACLRDGKWYEEQLTDDEANTNANADDDAGVDIVAKDTTTEPTNATPTATIQNHAAELREAAYRARCENAAAIVAEAAKSDDIDKQIENALVLDLECTPRRSRFRTQTTDITIHKRKQAGTNKRNMAVHTAVLWGWIQQ